MGLFRETIPVTSANNAVGKNILEGYDFAKASTKARRLKWIIVGGCNAVDEFSADLLYGNFKVGEVRNTLTGTTFKMNEDARPIEDVYYIAAGQELKLIVKSVYTVNPLCIEGFLATI